MSRTTETRNATITSTAVAPFIGITWNPHDDSGVVEFRTQIMESIDGQFRQMLAGEPLVVSIEDIMQREVTVTLPNGQTMPVAPGLIGLWIKQVFDDLYIERADARAAAAAAAEQSGNDEAPEV